MRIALVAYAVSPVKGSEPGNSWRVAEGLAYRGVEVELVTTAQNRNEWEDSPRSSSLNIHVVSNEIPKFLSRGHLGVYLRYLVFLKNSTNKIRQMSESVNVDLVHHYSWGQLNLGTSVWKIGIPTVFGPTGGGSVATRPMTKWLSRRARRFEFFRTMVIKLGSLNPRARAVARRCTVIAANRDTEKKLRLLGAHGFIDVVPETPTPEALINDEPVGFSDRDPGLLLWVGRLIPRKGIHLALEVLAAVDSRFRLVVVGDGPEWEEAGEIAKSLGIDHRVDFVGRVPWHEVRHYLDLASVFLFTSIRDTFGAQVLEASARGTPVVGIRHQGIGDHLPSAAGYLVEPTTPSALARSIAQGIDQLTSNPETWTAASIAARQFAEDHSLERLLDRLQVAHHQALSVTELRTSE